MNIEILPAQLANQIAAGEVVERPASVVKELVENSLDANATAIKITIEKGGAKRIRISDNGNGIEKEELTLALSRHATSKIKNLHDLEGINSLGFRGEALASISSVSRLTLTSKPKEQENAWQASAQGRDMEVDVTPAAHTDGTTIDVVDLFFNTPARRKFMRTEKTEFTHIEEVIKRIALARFDVAFTLVHNDKIVRQYRIANTSVQKAKRVAQVCGQAFIDNAVEVDCEHDGLTLQGWIAKPSFSRKQNDLCYSYVNGRMMRDKLINHAIRQSYQEMLLPETYPAFVLFLTLDVRDVDVNVHPAKHEVRFHQGRYVHDFIYSVCHRALVEINQCLELSDSERASSEITNFERENSERENLELARPAFARTETNSINYQENNAVNRATEAVQEYVTPLRYDVEEKSDNTSRSYSNNYHGKTHVPIEAASSYQALMTPLSDEKAQVFSSLLGKSEVEFHLVSPLYAIYFEELQPRLLSLQAFEAGVNQLKLEHQWEKGLISQPLLLPIKLSLESEEIDFIESSEQQFQTLGMVIQRLTKTSVQIRQYPALLRNQDVSQSFSNFLQKILSFSEEGVLEVNHWQSAFLTLIASEQFDKARILELYASLSHQPLDVINQLLTLNSKPIDLTSTIEQFD